jgi:hypothetical protein
MIEVCTGDVLLFRGQSFISKAIRFLDGSEVNHAGIAIDATRLAEALGHGLETGPIAAAVERNVGTWVLRAKRGDPAAAAARATQYASSGVPYAYQQILLLAALCLTRRIPIKNRVFRKVIRRVLDSAADLVNGMVDKGAELMICSEYVYRCYRETGLDLLPAGIPDLESAGSLSGDEVVLLDWLEGQPAPLALASTAPGITDAPAVVAERDTFAIEALLAEFFASEDPTVPVPASVDDEPVVTDEEITAAAVRFGRAALRAERQRNPQAPTPMSLGLGDLIQLLKGTLSTNANFVTPRDLFFTSALERLGTLP